MDFVPGLIMWSGISTAFLVIAVLLVPREESVTAANRYLAALVALLCYSLYLRFAIFTGLFGAPRAWFSTAIVAVMYVGPCLLFYIRILTNQERPHYAHWIPSLIVTVLTVALLLLLSPKTNLAGLLGIEFPSGKALIMEYRVGFQLPATLSLLAYCGYGLLLLHHHQQTIGDHFSSLDRINLKWLQTICWILIAAALALLVESPHEVVRSYWQGMIFVGLIYFTGFMGITQPKIFSQNVDATRPSSPLEKDADASAQLGSAQTWEELIELFEQQQPYLTPNLNLPRLADLLNVHPNRLSATINQFGECNFFDLINSQRIEHAKRLLKSDSQKGILDIAMDSGFNSKSTFYAQFKKFAGMSPSAYRSEVSLAN